MFRGEFLDRPVSIGQQFDELVFEGIEPSEFGFDVLADLLDRGVVVGEDLFEEFGDLGPFVFGDGEGGVVGFDGLLDVVQSRAGQVAFLGGVPFKESDAAEVEVFAAGVAAGGVEDQSATAASAPQQALEVALPGALSGSGAAFGEDVLDAVEDLGLDERFVFAGVVLAFPDDEAEVGAVGEDAADLGEVQGPARRVGLGRPGAQSGVGDELAQGMRAVLAGGVALEHQGDERAAHRVGLDDLDLAAFDGLAGVEVAEFRFARRAAAFGLAFHLGADVGSAGFGEVGVDLVENPGHELALGGLVGVVGGRDEPDAPVVEVSLGECGVDVVAEGARALVDDHRIDIAEGLDAFEEGLEDRPGGDGGGGVAGFDVFADEDVAGAIGRRMTVLALGLDGVPVRVGVGLHLPFCGDAKVQEGEPDHGHAGSGGLRGGVEVVGGEPVGPGFALECGDRALSPLFDGSASPIRRSGSWSLAHWGPPSLLWCCCRVGGSGARRVR
ncbi:hypothetical protein L0U85_03295 [Glycomyces sp. L485]|uniref:hypothetical protein n=1 Tax=Glycomyces sp. L485 TaxID=2909235 RepID=UPI001F4B54C5|nr:hypothetical protein [Glycomyces sp. L485]MCH7229887.1 hypothetical protein [Glycomyces sp. L485]